MNTHLIQLASMSALLLTLGGAGPLGPQVNPPQASESTASPVEGPKWILGRVISHSSWYRAIDLRGNETTTISLVGDGDTDLDLFIYDAAGDLVVSSDGSTDEEAVWVLPFRTGRYYIRVKNLGSVYNDFSLLVR